MGTQDITVAIGGHRHVVSNCITCGVTYTVPEPMWDRQRRESGFHHCPNGHSQGWSKTDSETEVLRRAKDRAVQEQARLADVAREADEHAVKAERSAQRLKKRAAAGVCPCCHRTVGQMRRHMASKHPGYVAENGANVVSLKARA